MNKVPEHQEGSTINCTPPQIRRRCVEFGYILASLDLCEFRIEQCEDGWNADDMYKSAIKDFWKTVHSGMTISHAKALDILKLDVGMADWKYRLFSKKYKEVA